MHPLWELGQPGPIQNIYGRPSIMFDPINPPPMEFPTTISNPLSAQHGDDKWTKLSPEIVCPNCGSAVNGLKDTQEILPPLHPTKFNQQPIKGITSQEVGPAVLTWRLHPCGCKVSVEWAGAYGKEVQRRKDGLAPATVKAMSDDEKAVKLASLEKAIASLLVLKQQYDDQTSEQVSKGLPPPPHGERVKVERELVLKVDALMKLCPGAHNVGKLSLMQETLAWAAKNKFQLPVATSSSPPTLAEIATFVKGGLVAASKAPQASSGYDHLKAPVNPSQVAAATLKSPSMPTTTPKLNLSGLVAFPSGYGLEITLPGNLPVPKVGDHILDENHCHIGRCSQVIPQPYGSHKIRVVTGPELQNIFGTQTQVPPLATKPLSPSSSATKPLTADEAAFEAAAEEVLADVVAKRIQQNIEAHVSKGTPLSPEAMEFLKHYNAAVKEVAGPQGAGTVGGNAGLEDRLGFGHRQRISKVRRKRDAEE